VSASWKWLVAGLVAAALLFGVGWIIGHRGATTGDAERQAWQARTDSLLGAARDQHRAVIDSLALVARADSVAAVEAERRADRARRAADSLAAEADTLAALVAVAQSAADSLALYPPLVETLMATVERRTAEAEALTGALGSVRSELAAWRATAERESRRVVELEEQLRSAPKPPRWRVRIWGADVRPGAFAGIALGGGATAGVGVVVTP